VRQAGDEAERHHPAEIRGEGAEQISRREKQHQPDEHGAPGQPRRGDRQNRRPYHHPERIGADDLPRALDADVKPLRKIRHQAHRAEFGGADGETAHGKREQRQPGMTLAGRFDVHSRKITRKTRCM
jgi:hypothetical protein